MSHLGAVVVKHFVCSRRYKVGYDPAGWLGVDPKTGDVTIVKSPDRESPHVVDGVYAVIVLAVDNGEAPPSDLDVSRSFLGVKVYLLFFLEADPYVSKKQTTNRHICQMSFYLLAGLVDMEDRLSLIFGIIFICISPPRS